MSTDIRRIAVSGRAVRTRGSSCRGLFRRSWLRISRSGLALAAVAAALSGCVSARPDTIAAAEELVRELPAAWTAASEPGPLSQHLLDLIDDDRLRDLVAEALAENQDLRAAARRLEASRRLLTETRAARTPFVTAGLDSSRGKQTIGLPGESSTENRHRLSLNVSWEVDVWRRLADQHAANTALTESQAADLAAARDALGARAIQAWVRAVSLRGAITIENDRVAIIERLQQTITSRFRRGIGSLDDLAAARSATDLARATLAGLEGDLEETTRALELLLGRLPRAELMAADTLPVVRMANSGYPAAAIVERHDVAVALWRLHAADASAAAAAKALLPGLRLTGDVAKDSSSLSDLLSADSIWNVLGSLTQPIFQRGLLKARSDASRLELEAAWEDYHGTVLRAVGEVEDALGRERSLTRQRDHVGSALVESARNTDVFEGRYRAGLASILELLQAEDQEMNINRQIIAIDGEILSNRITLALALGAGFEELG